MRCWNCKAAEAGDYENLCDPCGQEFAERVAVGVENLLRGARISRQTAGREYAQNLWGAPPPGGWRVKPQTPVVFPVIGSIADFRQ